MPSHDIFPIQIAYLGWNREGERPFEEARLDLVSIMDRLLNTLSRDGSPSTILLGGETILLDDYCEIRTGSASAIRDLIRARRVGIGPWYVLPQEQLASGESLVRNLLLGTQSLHKAGLWELPGYLAEAFYTGQMPQILASFGIQTVIAPKLRGEDLPLRQRWIGVDGSELIVLLIPVVDAQKNLEETKHLPRDQQIVLARIGLENPELVDALAGAGSIASSLAALASMDSPDLPIVEIQNREIPSDSASGAHSARMWIKQRNQHVESFLLHWAEPYGVWAASLRNLREDRVAPLDKTNEVLQFAWQTLLKNHSPEILSGRIADQSADEAAVRFDRVDQIAEYVVRDSLQAIANSIDVSDLAKRRHSYPLAIFNGTSTPKIEVVSVDIPAPIANSKIEVVNAAGQSVPFDYISGQSDIPHLEFVADIPAIGYATYVMRSSRKTTSAVEFDSGESIENEFISVQINTEDGTISLFDKRTGRLFSALNRYSDGGDAGTLSHFQSPEHDTTIDIATNTPLRTQRRIGSAIQSLDSFQIFRLPQTLTEDRTARLPLAAQFVPISIWTTVSLVQAVPRVDVSVTISNAATDHRLRVHFPTGIGNALVYLDGIFHVHEEFDTEKYVEKIQHGFVTIVGGETGLTLSSRGLPEVAISRTPEDTGIAMTLLRSVGLTQNSSPAPRGQCIGEYSYRYSLIPHNTDLLSVWREAWATQSDAMVVPIENIHGDLPSVSSLVDCDCPAFLITTVKQAADGSDDIVIRGFNVSSTRQKVKLNLAIPITEVRCIELDEQETTTKQVNIDRKKRVTFDAGPFEIVTLRFSS